MKYFIDNNYIPNFPTELKLAMISHMMQGNQPMPKELTDAVAPFALPEKRVKVLYSDKSKTKPFGQVSTKAEWFTDYAHLDPTLEQYQSRQDLQKMVTTDIPRLKIKGQLVRTCHPQYDAIKETSAATSSFSARVGRIRFL